MLSFAFQLFHSSVVSFPFRFEFFCRDSDRGTRGKRERERDEGKGKEKKGIEETKSWLYYSVGCTRLPVSELNNRSSDGGTGTSL